ncbi:dihydroorotase [Sesbania bispinosa]|nr:dihydroorotase [Sesbania bispinosa]
MGYADGFSNHPGCKDNFVTICNFSSSKDLSSDSSEDDEDREDEEGKENLVTTKLLGMPSGAIEDKFLEEGGWIVQPMLRRMPSERMPPHLHRPSSITRIGSTLVRLPSDASTSTSPFIDYPNRIHIGSVAFGCLHIHIALHRLPRSDPSRFDCLTSDASTLIGYLDRMPPHESHASPTTITSRLSLTSFPIPRLDRHLVS